MKTFVVETYLPGTHRADFDQARKRLSAAIGPDPVRVRYLRSTFVPADEMCFHVFEADSADDVRAATDLAAISIDRIVEAVEGS